MAKIKVLLLKGDIGSATGRTIEAEATHLGSGFELRVGSDQPEKDKTVYYGQLWLVQGQNGQERRTLRASTSLPIPGSEVANIDEAGLKFLEMLDRPI